MMIGKPLCVDLFCGLGGWADGFLAEGYDVIGFDIERHDYGTGGYPAQLVLQDVLTLHGSQWRDAAVIVASPPCQFFSYTAMPWSRAKKLAEEVRNDPARLEKELALFRACFRIAREAGVPLVVENVCGAQAWVGPAKWHYGSFYLWGDVPALMPITGMRLALKGGDRNKGRSNGDHKWDTEFKNPGFRFDGSGRSFQSECVKNTGGSWFNVAHNTTSGVANNPVSVRGGYRQISEGWRAKHYGDTEKMHLTNQRESDGVKVPGINLSEVGFNVAIARTIDPMSKPSGFKRDNEMKRQHIGFSRKAASAQIAKIPFTLARHIARVFKPDVTIRSPT